MWYLTSVDLRGTTLTGIIDTIPDLIEDEIPKLN